MRFDSGWWELVLCVGAVNLDPFGWFFLPLRVAPPVHAPTVLSWILRGPLGPPKLSIRAALSSLGLGPRLQQSHLLGSGSLTQGAHLDFSSSWRSWNILKAVSWAHSRLHLTCSFSRRGHCSLLHDVWCLKNHCLTVSDESWGPKWKRVYYTIDTYKGAIETC